MPNKPLPPQTLRPKPYARRSATSSMTTRPPSPLSCNPPPPPVGFERERGGRERERDKRLHAPFALHNQQIHQAMLGGGDQEQGVIKSAWRWLIAAPPLTASASQTPLFEGGRPPLRGGLRPSGPRLRPAQRCWLRSHVAGGDAPTAAEGSGIAACRRQRPPSGRCPPRGGVAPPWGVVD